MLIRIGKFNGIPLYLEIFAPHQWFRQLKAKRPLIASLGFEPVFYDLLKAKNEGTITSIPRKDLPKDLKYITWTISYKKIVVQPYFLLLPKINKLFVLWHEYGHSVVPLVDEKGYKSSFNEVYEAIASFYACCKLKLHFNEYIKIENFSPIHKLSLKKRKYDKVHLHYEKRYNKLHSGEIPLEERTEEDHIYEFYKDKDMLIGWYMLCFNEICTMDYQSFFDWNDFLAEIGWDNDEERRKYIS